jgi:membrane associated rhomboid family serine protease
MKLVILLSTIAVMVITTFADIASSGKIHEHGIHPHSMKGLSGILFAPFLHVSMSHLFVNLLPLVFLGTIVLMRPMGIKTFLTLSGFATLFAGGVVWLIGDDAYSHVGSSVLVFAFFSFILLHGIITKTWRDAMFAFGIMIAYGTTFLSMFTQAIEQGPTVGVGATPISWMYMLGGFGAGICYAFFDARMRQHGADIYGYNRAHEKGTSEERAGIKASVDDEDEFV